MSTLYELSENYKNILDLAENPDVTEEMITSALDSIQCEIEVKCENIGKLIKSLEGEAAAVKSEAKRLSDKEKALNNKIKNLKDYIQAAMITTGKTKIKGTLFSFNIQKNPASVKVVSDADIPAEYLVDQPKLVNKKAILEKLKAGELVPGCELQQTESVRIR